ncbi:MAG TPA: tetratricopeptide repeat protein [Rhizomicrobium sp.]
MPSAEFEQALQLHRGGARDAAERIYRRILQTAPNHFGATHMLGVVHLQRGEIAEAERLLSRALALEPLSPEALNHHGTALRRRDRFAEALAAFDRAIALKPDYPEALANRGNVLVALGRPREAVASYDRAIALKPGDADTHYNRGAALEALQQWDAAIASYDQAVFLRPAFPQAFNNLGNALKEAGKPADAVASYDRAIALRPDYADALSNRGAALRDLGRSEEALASFAAALAARPQFAEAHNNRGCTLRDLCRFDDAMEDFAQALAIAPDYAEARWNTALTQLLLGDWEHGWENAEARFHKTRNPVPRPVLAVPEWRGEALAGRKLLVFCEQGYGDAIQFIRFVPLPQARGAQITVLADRRLHALLGGAVTDVSFTDSVGDARFDFQIALMSVPRVLGTTPATVPANAPYLAVDPARADVWRARLGNDGFKVGLCWQGNPAGAVDRGRSLPLAELAPLARVPGVRLISLQKIHGLEQFHKRPRGMSIETPGHDFDDGRDAFVDTAAMMLHLDLVITSDTAIAHLAGALGRPVWTALKHVPDWRWLLGRSDTPWYPTMRLFRQPRAGDWAAVVRAMTEALHSAAGPAAGNVHFAA